MKVKSKAERQREYQAKSNKKRRADPEYRKKEASAVLGYARLHRKENAASAKARYAIRIGYLKKPKGCEFCGRKTRLHGHHTDYAKIYGVLWLCPSCHSLLHIQLRKTKEVVDNA